MVGLDATQSKRMKGREHGKSRPDHSVLHLVGDYSNSYSLVYTGFQQLTIQPVTRPSINTTHILSCQAYKSHCNVTPPQLFSLHFFGSCSPLLETL